MFYTNGSLIRITSIQRKDYFWPDNSFEELAAKVNGKEGVILWFNSPSDVFDERVSYQVRVAGIEIEVEPDEFQSLVVENIEDATHWLAKEDVNNEVASVTPGKHYPVLLDDKEEYHILNDEGTHSLIFLVHSGDYLRLES